MEGVSLSGARVSDLPGLITMMKGGGGESQIDSVIFSQFIQLYIRQCCLAWSCGRVGVGPVTLHVSSVWGSPRPLLSSHLLLVTHLTLLHQEMALTQWSRAGAPALLRRVWLDLISTAEKERDD